MKRILLAAAALALSVAAARAELKIENVKAVHGQYGPERKSLDAYPFDEIYFRYTVTGAKTDADGKLDGTVILELADSKGKVLLNQKSPIKGQLALGGGTFFSTAFLNFGGNVPPGEYNLKLTVRDNLSEQTASFERKLTCKPVAFGIVAPAFFYDANMKIPAPAGGLLGQQLHFRIHTIGFDRSQDKIDTEMTVQVLDDKGKETLPKPIKSELASKDEEVVKKANSVTFRGNLVLNRAGNFTLRITITDKVAKKTTKLEMPLKVTAP